MFKEDKSIPVTSIADLNTYDNYALNTDIETYDYLGKVVIPAGSLVNFICVTEDLSKVLIRTSKGIIEQVPFSCLNNHTSFIGKIVTLPKGITLPSHDGLFGFDKSSKFKIEGVFYTNLGQYRPEERTFFIIHLNDKGEGTSITSIVSYYDIELV